MSEQLTETVLPSPGTQLREAREKAGLSVREVAEKMHQLPRQVTALENDDYQQFSGDIFCRGYIKTYSNLLGLDTQALLEGYSQLCPKPVENFATANPPQRHIQRPTRGHSIQYWGAAASVVVIFLVWFFSVDGASEDQVDVIPLLEVEIDKQPVIASAAGVDSKGALGAGNDVTSMPELNNKFEEATMVDEVTIASTSVVADADISMLSSELVAEAGPVESSLLQISFLEDCWVQVKDGNEELIFADLKRASQTLELKGQAPFYIVLGYAPGVTVEFNGESVSVPVNPQNNSARFVVGRD